MAGEALDALESRSLPEVKGVPELTQEQKTKVLLLQRQILTMQVNINQLQKQLEQMPQALNSLLSQVVQELGVNPEEFTFDLDNLKLMPKV